MVKNITSIDTVAIQLDNCSDKEQRYKFDLIWGYIFKKQLGNLNKDKERSTKNVHIYNLLYGNSKLATLHTGFAPTTKSYYIRIRWCGLKSFNYKQDKASYKALITIIALLNTNCFSYRFVELDIAIDMFCDFSNVIGTKYLEHRPNNVKYNPLGYVQYFNGIPTSYIENYSNKVKKKAAMMRFYIYNKSAKEKINNKKITRAELKLQNRFFVKKGFNLASIQKALDKYTIIYFKDTSYKQRIVNLLNAPNTLNDLNLFMLESSYNDNHRINADLDVVKKFISQMITAYIDLLGNVVISKKKILDI
ncbi:MAG: hypothetical protein ACQERD_09315 [Campylobacterota bacterium]